MKLTKEIKQLNLKLNEAIKEELELAEYFEVMTSILNNVLIIRRFIEVDEIKDFLTDISTVKMLSKFYDNEVQDDEDNKFYVEEKEGEMYFVSEQFFDEFVGNVISNVDSKSDFILNDGLMNVYMSIEFKSL